MKATASSVVGKVLTERSAAVSLPISVWDEGAFEVSVGEVVVSRPRWEMPDWDDIETIGAADDPARFKIGLPVEETSDAVLKSHF